MSERAYPNWAMKRVYAGNGPSSLAAQLRAMGIAPAEIAQVEQFFAAHTIRAA
jgi:hypothetical protein